MSQGGQHSISDTFVFRPAEVTSVYSRLVSDHNDVLQKFFSYAALTSSLVAYKGSHHLDRRGGACPRLTLRHDRGIKLGLGIDTELEAAVDVASAPTCCAWFI